MSILSTPKVWSIGDINPGSFIVRTEYFTPEGAFTGMWSNVIEKIMLSPDYDKAVIINPFVGVRVYEPVSLQRTVDYLNQNGYRLAFREEVVKAALFTDIDYFNADYLIHL